MRSLLVLCLFVFVLFAVAQEKKPVGNVRCYVCNSLSAGQQNCSSSDETALKPYLKSCPKISDGQLSGRTATSCRKILQEVHEQEAVIRECAYTGEDEVDGKRRIGNKGIILWLYQCFPQDGAEACNSASTVTLFAASLFSAAVAIIGFRL